MMIGQSTDCDRLPLGFYDISRAEWKARVKERGVEEEEKENLLWGEDELLSFAVNPRESQVTRSLSRSHDQSFSLAVRSEEA